MEANIMVRGLARVAKKLQTIDSDMTIGNMIILLAVVEKERVQMSELVELTGQTLAGVSRTISLFTKHGSRNKEGLGLMESQEDPQERRRKIITLTTEGKKMAADIKRIMNGACTRATEE